MSDKYFAKLTKKNDTVFLHILKNKEDAGKLIFKSNKTDEILKKLQSLLNLSSLEAMIQRAEGGDELSFRFDREFEKEINLPFERIEKIVKHFNTEGQKSIEKEVYQEIYNNFLSDLIASSIESLYEQLIYQIFEILGDLALKNLVIVPDGFLPHDRLITLITKHAPLIDLDVSFASLT